MFYWFSDDREIAVEQDITEKGILLFWCYSIIKWVSCKDGFTILISDHMNDLVHIIMIQCMTKGGLWHNVILVRKKYYDVNAVYFSIWTKPEPFEQWKINVMEE